MTSQGSASARFQRALQARNLFQAELAAREMGSMPLDDALGLCELLAESGDARFERAAVRWHGRLELERPGLAIADAQFALAALGRMRDDLPIAASLAALL